FKVHEIPQIRAENVLFGSPAPTVWLQSHLWHGVHDLRWWDYATWGIYLTHFLATLIAAAVLWTFAHDRFARYATMVCVLATTGFSTYLLYPASPPWLAARHGNVGESNRIVPLIWKQIPIDHFNTLFERGVRYANNVAALPSLHAGYALLFSMYLWPLVPRFTRPLLALYPLAMAFALVYTGMIDSTPELDEEWHPALLPWPELGDVRAIVNTHLHFDHCGGNRRFAGTPTYVQRRELEAAVAPDYVEEWVRFPGASYVE